MFIVYTIIFCHFFFFFKQKTAYEMRISDWSSDVCSSDLLGFPIDEIGALLSLWSDRSRASADVKALALARADELGRTAAALEAMRASLVDLAERCRGDDRPDCPILARLRLAYTATLRPEVIPSKNRTQRTNGLSLIGYRGTCRLAY